MVQRLEQLAQEWRMIGGTGDLPKLDAQDYLSRVQKVLYEFERKNGNNSASNPFVKCLVNSQLQSILQEKGINYNEEKTSDEDLLNAYKVVAQLELDFFQISVGFNGGLLYKGFDVYDVTTGRGTIDEGIIRNVARRGGLFEKNEYGREKGNLFFHVVKGFEPQTSEDFKDGPFFGEYGNRYLTQFVNEIYEKNPSFLDNLASVQEEVYKKGILKVGEIQKLGYSGYNSASVGNRIILGNLRPLIRYAQQHKILPFESGREGDNWNFEKVFKVR